MAGRRGVGATQIQDFSRRSSGVNPVTARTASIGMPVASMRLCGGEWITPADLMLLAREGPGARGGAALQGRTLDSVEKEAIQATLSLCEANKTRAASLLGIRPNTLRDKMKRHGLPW